MNQTQAAAAIATSICKIEDCRAKVKTGSVGEVLVVCERNSGGKKGWITAGIITVSEVVTISSETKFAFRYLTEELMAAVAVTYQLESPQAAGESRVEFCIAMKKAAADHQRGLAVDQDILAEAVTYGYLSMSDAMNSDF
jgi:hypothetical protein